MLSKTVSSLLESIFEVIYHIGYSNDFLLRSYKVTNLTNELIRMFSVVCDHESAHFMIQYDYKT